jgi:hypothetical protein
MRPHHTKAAQFELFGLSDQANTVTTPAWQTLRPHSAIGNKTPMELIKTIGQTSCPVA